MGTKGLRSADEKLLWRSNLAEGVFGICSGECEEQFGPFRLKKQNPQTAETVLLGKRLLYFN